MAVPRAAAIVRFILLVGLAVAVVVDPVAAGVVRPRVQRRAVDLLLAVDAGHRARRHAGADPAAGGLHVVFLVGVAVAVVVHAVAGGVVD
jgi:hypothetical protein